MNPNLPRVASTPAREWSGAVAVLALLVGAIWAVRNLPWHLDDFDQAKQAFVSFEMVRQGHWWFQHTPVGHIATKPPLAGWISALLWLATGGVSWDFAWRFPGAAAAAILLWRLGREGELILGREGRLLAMGAFGLNLMTPRLVTLVRTDMLLGLFISLVGLQIYRKVREGTAWTNTDRCWLSAFLLGSMMTKGPIAYAFLLPGLLGYGILQRRNPAWPCAWSGWWSWFAPLLPFGVWVGCGIWGNRAFYEQVVQHEFLGRFTVGEQAVHHNQPVYFYLLHLLRDFFPWSALLLALACLRAVRGKVREDPALLWLACWSLGGLLFMSLVPSKRADRIFPVLVPFSLLVPALAAQLPVAMPGKEWLFRPVFSRGILALAALFAGGYAAGCIVHSHRVHNGALVAFARQVRSVCRPERLAVTDGKDEGMLLYLDRVQFTKDSDAMQQWRAHVIDAWVAPSDGDRPLDAVVAFKSAAAPEKENRYVCLVRPPGQTHR